MYTLWKTVGTEPPQIIGYYDNWAEGMNAVEEDRAKNDEVNVGYDLKSDKKEDDADNGNP